MPKKMSAKLKKSKKSHPQTNFEDVPIKTLQKLNAKYMRLTQYKRRDRLILLNVLVESMAKCNILVDPDFALFKVNAHLNTVKVWQEVSLEYLQQLRQNP